MLLLMDSSLQVLDIFVDAFYKRYLLYLSHCQKGPGRHKTEQRASTCKYRLAAVHLCNDVVHHYSSLLNSALQPCFLCSLDGFSAIELSLITFILSELQRETGGQHTGNAGCKLIIETLALASGSRKGFPRIAIHPAQTTKRQLKIRKKIFYR